jgi:hypothetical protein
MTGAQTTLEESPRFRAGRGRQVLGFLRKRFGRQDVNQLAYERFNAV